MAAIFTNFAYSTLAASIDNSQLTLVVAAGHGARFPAPTGAEYFYATLESALLVREIVKVTARSTDTFTIVRAQDNTTANAFTAGDSVALRLNAAAITDMEVASSRALKSATTDVSVSSATAPTVGQVLMATSSTAATWQTLGPTGVYTNVNNTYTKTQAITPVTLTSTSNSIAVDASLSNNFRHVLTEDTTLAKPTNLVDGMHGFIRFKQHASSAKTLAFNAAYKFEADTDPTMPTGLGKVALLAWFYDSGDDVLYCTWTGVTGLSP